MSKFETDNVDVCSGVYDRITKEGLPGHILPGWIADHGDSEFELGIATI
jgi:hypothetical protein